MRTLIQKINPSWAAAVMGTGVLSILLAGQSGSFAIAGLVLFWINTVVLVYSLFCWILMWFVAPGKIKQMVNNAGMLVFLPTVPVDVAVWASSLIIVSAVIQDSAPGKRLAVTVATEGRGTVQFRKESSSPDSRAPRFPEPVRNCPLPVAVKSNG